MDNDDKARDIYKTFNFITQFSSFLSKRKNNNKLYKTTKIL